MLDSVFNSKLHEWITSALELDSQHVYRANQNGKQDDYNVMHVTYSILGSSLALSPNVVKSQGEDPLTEILVSRQYSGTAVVSVDAYGTDAKHWLQQLDISRYERATRLIFSSVGAALISSSPIRDLNFVSDTMQIGRSQADFNFNIYASRTEVEAVINSVDLNGHIEDMPTKIERTL